MVLLVAKIYYNDVVKIHNWTLREKDMDIMPSKSHIHLKPAVLTTLFYTEGQCQRAYFEE